MKVLEFFRKSWPLWVMLLLALLTRCQSTESAGSPPPEQILGNQQYDAIAYGGFRNRDRSKAPSVEEVKEDMRLLHAMGIRFVRTYHARLHQHAERVLEAIESLKEEDEDFEMYVMFGCWIQCADAFTASPDHSRGDSTNNRAEIEAAIKLAQQYPDIVKVIAVGNESMVHWASSYFVEPAVVLKWVTHLQNAKKEGILPQDLWITSSDNYASWGGEPEYHTVDLRSLIEAVDYLSVHSYPFHDTHYNPEFWYVPRHEEDLEKEQVISQAMDRAVNRVEDQFLLVRDYVESLGQEKEIHIGETGWASADNSLYGSEGSKAADEYKQYLYYKRIRDWSDSAGVSCFYFEAFDEPWKDGENPMGSENHFGLFDVEGSAKLPIYEELRKGAFDSLGRSGKPVGKSSGQSMEELSEQSERPAFKSEVPISLIEYPEGIKSSNELRILPIDREDSLNYPAAPLKANAWEGTCVISIDTNAVLTTLPDEGDWWGGALELQGEAMDIRDYQKAKLEFEIRGNYSDKISLGFMTGDFAKGTQQRAAVVMNGRRGYKITKNWQPLSIPVEAIAGEADLSEVTALFFLSGENAQPDDSIQVRNISYFR